MNQQQAAAMQSMKEWLSHPGELGKEPAKIEPAGEFDLHGLHYYMFRYKKGILGKWLLGVCGGYGPGDTEHCGHVFSEMEPYDAATAVDKAKEMVEMIRRYWMEQAKALEQEARPVDPEGSGEDSGNVNDACREDAGRKDADRNHAVRNDTDGNDINEDGNQEENDETGTFVGFVLLSEPHWSPDKLAADMKADWGIDCIEEEDGETSGEDVSANDEGNTAYDDEDAPHIYSINGLRLVVAMMDAPVPEGEAEANAANNYMWPEAVETVKTHKAHLMVAIMGKDAPVKERGLLFAKLMAACCRQETVLGVYTSGTVFQPRFYLDASEMMKDGGLPILNWIYFGLYQTEGGWNTYTYGMRAFGRDEMEVLDVRAEPQELRDYLLNLAYYVLDGDVVLRDGETLGFTAEQKLPITRSKGVSLDGVTLKIGYPES